MKEYSLNYSAIDASADDGCGKRRHKEGCHVHEYFCSCFLCAYKYAQTWTFLSTANWVCLSQTDNTGAAILVSSATIKYFRTSSWVNGTPFTDAYVQQ